MRLFRDLWKDEGGFIISAELVLIATLLVVGVLVGLNCLQKAVVGELTDVSGALNTLDQSFYYHGHSSYIRGSDGCIRLKSAVLGSSYVDRRHRIIGTEADLPGYCPPGTVVPEARANVEQHPSLTPKAPLPKDDGPDAKPTPKDQLPCPKDAPAPKGVPCPTGTPCPNGIPCPNGHAAPNAEAAPGAAATEGAVTAPCPNCAMYPPVDFWGTPLPPIVPGRGGIGRPCETFVLPFYTAIPPYLLMSPGNIARLPRPCAPAPGAVAPGYYGPGYGAPAFGPGSGTPAFGPGSGSGVAPGVTTPGLEPQRALPADPAKPAQPAEPTPVDPMSVPQKSKIL